MAKSKLEAVYNCEEEKDESSLIRVEMNCIEYPLFSKNRKIKIGTKTKYIFNREKWSSLEIEPGFNNRVPGEFEERLFYGLLRIYSRERYVANTIYTDYSTIIKEMDIMYNGKNKLMVKDGLNRLNSTIYIFNNCFYSNILSGIKNECVRTNMFNITYIEFSNELCDLERSKFRNSKIKEIIKIKFSDEFFNNMVSRGFLRFDSSILFSIKDVVARDIYKLITKWRNKKHFISVSSKKIASRIPLSFNATNIPKSIQRIERAFKYLMENGFLKRYQLVKEKKLENSIFNIYFEEMHNFDYYSDIPKMKQLRLDRVEDKANGITERRKEHSLRELVEVLPDKLKIFKEEKMKWVEILRKEIKNHSMEYLKQDIRYSKKEADDFERFFFKSIKSGHWGVENFKREEQKNSLKDETKKAELEKEKCENEEQKILDEKLKKYDEIFNGYSEDEKEEIFSQAVKIMRLDGNIKISEKMDRFLFNTAYKYKIMENREQSIKK